MSSCFVMMPFDKDYRRRVFDAAIRPVVLLHGLECTIADHHRGDIYEQIDAGVRKASICIADITDHRVSGAERDRANVVYELGIAHALGRPVVIVARAGTRLPFAVQRWKVLFYSDPTDLRRRLLDALTEVLGSDPSRTCFVPAHLRQKRPAPFVLAANQLSRRGSLGLKGGFRKPVAVGGDSLVVARLMDRFARFGLPSYAANPEDYRDSVLTRSAMNLYCIGSSRANRWTERVLSELSRIWSDVLMFRYDPDAPEQSACIVDDCGEERFTDIPAELTRDVGLVVRAPNPWHPDAIVLILAGRRVTGTEAAFFALSDTRYLTKLDAKVRLDDHQDAFRMAVEMSRCNSRKAFQPDLESLKVVDIQTLKRR